jgi:hypothetical protein
VTARFLFSDLASDSLPYPEQQTMPSSIEGSGEDDIVPTAHRHLNLYFRFRHTNISVIGMSDFPDIAKHKHMQSKYMEFPIDIVRFTLKLMGWHL